jgi:hypothetical protein
MAETFWESEVAEQQQPEQQGESAASETQVEPAALTVSADDFSALEERIVRAVELVKKARQARAAAEERATQAEAKISEQVPRIEQLEKELHALKGERDQVRQRVERLLAQLDTLEL